MKNESFSTISQVTTESVTINEKTNLQPSTKTLPSTTDTAAHTPAQEEVKQNINTENGMQVGLFQKRDLSNS